MVTYYAFLLLSNRVPASSAETPNTTGSKFTFEPVKNGQKATMITTTPRKIVNIPNHLISQF